MISRRVAELRPSIIREMFARRRPTSLDLTLGEPALPPDRDVLDAAWAKLRSGAQGYTPNAGLSELRALIGKHHGLEGRDAEANVIVTVGSQEAVFLAMASTLDVGDEVLIPEPGYPAYRNIATFLGAKAVPYPIERSTGLVARADAIAPRMSERTKLLITNSPSNPFGTIDPPEEQAAIAALADARGVPILSDEIYSDLHYGEAPRSIAQRSPRAMVATGLSKSCALTGHRLGYLIAPSELVPKAILAHQLLVTCAPRLAQLSAIEILSEPSVLRRHIAYYRETRAALEATKDKLPADAPLMLGEGAFYAILDVSRYAGGDPLALAIALLDAEDVALVPGTAFGPTGDWFFRVSYAAGPQASREGLARIGRFLSARSPAG